jgi:Recombinase
MKGKFTGEARARATRAIVEQADARARLLAPAIAEIRAGGLSSYKGIAAQLEARGIPTARGGRWAATQVRDIVLRSTR